MAKLSPKVWYLLKYGFLALIATGIFLTLLPVSKPEEGPDILDVLGDNFSEPYVDQAFTLDILRKDVTVCLTKSFQEESSEKRSLVKDNTTSSEDLSSITEDSSIFTVLSSFNNILSLVGVKSAIIEPSMLYCMLHPYYQVLLSEKNFNITHVSGSKDIVTYGVLRQDVNVLHQEENIAQFIEAGFVPYFVKVPQTDWMQSKTTSFKLDTFISHIFYKHTFCTIHIVVFQERSSYLWHAALDYENELSINYKQSIPPKNELLFVDHNGAYEKFAFTSLESKVVPLADFYIPSNSHYFLFEMSTSRFLECNSSRAVNTRSYANHPKSHSGMSVEYFNERVVIALRELKSIFHPMLMNLWIWSGTMLGWYRECDIIPYTSDVDFAAWASEVGDLDLMINLLLNNKHVAIKERMGMLEEALEFNINCYGVRTDVFFLYRIENGSWCSGHRPKFGNYFRYYYPHFNLCSAELLGEKVQVPCETEDVILIEYGLEWSTPVSKWHYVSSIRNRGPDIYWDKKKLKDSYRVYY